jgi:hypothetical protein
MKCKDLQPLFGRFLDGELSALEAASVRAHLDQCPACSAELSSIAELGQWVQATRAPEPSPERWEQARADVFALYRTRLIAANRRSWVWKIASIAALFMVGTAVALLASRIKAPLGDLIAENTVDLGPFVADPTHYQEGHPVTLQEAVRQVSFPVLDTKELPGGYQFKKCCLCCKSCGHMVQCCYLRGSDQVLVLQYGCERPTCCGNRPTIKAEVNKKTVNVVECDKNLVASWRCDGTAVSLIGPKDLDEMLSLVKFIDAHLSRQ